MDERERDYYDDYRNGYYNPDDDDKEPGLNENWKAVQEGFYKVKQKDDAQDERLDDLEEAAGLWEAGTGTGAVKMKYATAASGVNAIAEGADTTASGANAHAEGYLQQQKVPSLTSRALPRERQRPLMVPTLKERRQLPPLAGHTPREIQQPLRVRLLTLKGLAR